MLKSHEKFHSAHGKRLVLVADDEAINRELLGAVLADTYEVIFAGDGAEALRLCEERRDTLSLVLLDLMMPRLSGVEVLAKLREDPELRRLPVIVVTADQAAEVESLGLGAVDFIPKPYPQADVILARAQRTIELYEDRDIISSTERDPLTGLYNREYFYRYAEQFDRHHPDLEMDAIVIDVNHFHMINERFGTDYGDEVLRRIGEGVRAVVSGSDGIVCRREADTYLVYCPHGGDYEAILEGASAPVAESLSHSRVRLRMGVYSRVDKTLDIERRFDRAQMAADRVQGSVTKTIGVYDSSLHEKELYDEQLVDDFRRAVEDRQFLVYYQPKFDVRPEVPRLASCEALVRWKHPDLGMISPAAFIPLFEENGLIQELDTYVWRETARQLRAWKDELGYTVPVSVNVSRIDLYDPEIVETLEAILRDSGLSCRDMYLEVTESAYTEDSQQIIRTVERLRQLGFQIEMDDFGTGYSSLNMITSLPIDALKLDMQFTRTAFQADGDTRMLEVIVDIARTLTVPIIAEGVETAEQMRTLRAMGCDIIQGYYFSKPVPAEECAAFLAEARDAEDAVRRAKAEMAQELASPEELPADGASAEAEEPAEPAEDASDGSWGFHLRTASLLFVVIALIAAVSLFLSDISVTRGYQRMEEASSRYIVAQLAASDMESGSDYLTDRVRCFVVTGEIDYMEDFFEEIEVTRRRDRALESLEVLLEDSESNAYTSLAAALQLSNELVEREYHAMRLMLETGDYPAAVIPPDIAAVRLDDEDLALTPQEMAEKAESLVFDNTYMHYKDRIRENVSLCTQELIRASSLELEEASAQMALYVRLQTALTVVFLLIVLMIVLFITLQVRVPLTRMVEMMRSQQSIPPTGAEELRFATRTYNAILKENRIARERLSHEASHDPLTGLFNRGAYELMLESVDREHMALILVDVDYFKTVNDTYGHDVGDRILCSVADVLRHSFRSVDVICRIGGDEFVVLMTRVNSSMRDLVVEKIRRANDKLRHPTNGLPPVSLSVGVAFADRENPQGDIFKDADTALYRVKEAGRSGCAVY